MQSMDKHTKITDIASSSISPATFYENVTTTIVSSTSLTESSDINEFPIKQYSYKGTDIPGVTKSTSSTDENYINQKRLEILEQKFSDKLISLIHEEDFEYGIGNKTDELVLSQINLNALATKEWLNNLFVKHFDNVAIIAGILRIVARTNYMLIYPQGQTMAIAALSHSSTEVQECGVRAFENWGRHDSIKILENTTANAKWLQEYINDVILDIKAENSVNIG